MINSKRLLTTHQRSSHASHFVRRWLPCIYTEGNPFMYVLTKSIIKIWNKYCDIMQCKHALCTELRMDPKTQLRRSRMHYNLCNEILGYSAYKRHHDFSHLFGPGYVLPAKCHHDDAVSDSSDSTFILEESASMSPSFLALSGG